MNILPIRFQPLAFVLSGLLTGSSANAAPQHDAEHDHDRARQALSRGEVRPITEILTQVATEVPGEVVEVEFERSRRHGAEAWIYELKIMAEDGRLLEVQVDAATSRVLVAEEKD
ncbi:PepSY domain-containing protein [Thiocystis violacea]|uniref:PepSY domain-containing protein n=1 Tax=Thiocystis violacea TaxID=13725 RepID=UPI001F5B8A02|nr:peptidase M4 [Thiocystis violacea]MBK1717046.1 hypothetical protein [Thiocystis violacea]